MSHGLSDVGEEYCIRRVFTTDVSATSVVFGLYYDATDNLQDSEDLADITTEPQGAAYARQGSSLDTTDFTASDVSGDWRAESIDHAFDLSDSTQTVDSFFIVINFQSSDKGDGSATDHVFGRGGLGEVIDASSESGTYNLTAPGMSLA